MVGDSYSRKYFSSKLKSDLSSVIKTKSSFEQVDISNRHLRFITWSVYNFKLAFSKDAYLYSDSPLRISLVNEVVQRFIVSEQFNH